MRLRKRKMRIPSDGYSEEFPNYADKNAGERERKPVIVMSFVLLTDTKLRYCYQDDLKKNFE